MNVNFWLINNIDDFNRFTINGGKVILITEDPDPYIRNNPSAIMGSILLPSYSVLSAEIDDDAQRADALYFQELSREEPDGYLVSILAALYSGIPIALYFSSSEFDMRFVQVFLQYIYQAYGMVPGFGATVPRILDEYDGQNLDKIYYLNLMPFDKYIKLRPGVTNNPSIMNKMVYDVKPPVKDYEYQTIFDFFSRIKADVDEFGKYYTLPIEKVPGETRKDLPL